MVQRILDTVQPLIDRIDDQINKTRSPLMNTILASPIYIIVSLPLAMVAAVVVLIVTGTTGQVGQSGALPGIVAGIVTILVFWGWAAYGTYHSNEELQNGNEL